MQLSKEELTKIYYLMLKIRLTEEEIAHRYNEQKMRCPTHLSIGQEAVPSVLGVLLKDSDYAISTHRGHAHYMGKGGHIGRMIAEIYGKKTGCAHGRGGSMHLLDMSVGFMGTTAIVGNSIPLGVGFALSAKIKKEKNVSAVFFGDGAVEEGAFYESANFAALKKLPVLFVCENNFYSVYSHIKARQPENRKIHKMVESMGMLSIDGDGNDVDDSYAKLNTAIEHIRAGKGPAFVELYTYRWREHCGPNFDNNIGYRTEEEFQEWKKRDPIALFKSKLLGRGFASVDLDSVEFKVKQEVQEAFDFAEKSPYPEQDEAFHLLFKEI